MNPETLFSICSALVIPGWLLLIIAPRWPWSTRLIASVLIPLLLAAVYSYLIVAHFSGAEGGFGSLAEVSRLFQNPHALLAGWLHYLAFDLFVGSWEVREARRENLPHLLVIPCLVLTFLFGPAGLLLFFVLRWGMRRRLLLGAEHAHS